MMVMARLLCVREGGGGGSVGKIGSSEKNIWSCMVPWLLMKIHRGYIFFARIYLYNDLTFEERVFHI